MSESVPALHINARVKVVSARNGPDLEARINAWLEANAATHVVYSITASPKGSRVYALITHCPLP